MRPIFWGDGTRWGDPNVYWGSPSYRLEPGDPGYVDNPDFPPPLPLTPIQPPTKAGRKTMATDYVPQSEENLREWCDKQVSDLTEALATAMNATAAERTGYLMANNTILGVLGPIVQKQDELDELRANLSGVLAAQLPLIRAFIKRCKTSPGCTPAIQTQLEWLGDSQTFDPHTARPTIVVEVQRGRVKISGKKPGFEAYNLYWRKKGDVEWKLLAIRKRKFPYYDETPLAVANTPEVREYMAIGVINDEETGQSSEIKEIVYAG